MRIYEESKLQGFTKTELINLIIRIEEYIDELEEQNCNQFKLLMQNEQYRWHDLRKNPEDLPNDSSFVEVKAKMKCEWDGSYRIFTLQMTYKAKVMYGKPIGWGYGYPYDFNFETDEVIAWREIEPFEEVEE